MICRDWRHVVSPLLRDTTSPHLFFCQPIFIGDETVLFRETNSERRPISPKNFNPAFSGLRISKRLEGLELSILLIAVNSFWWVSSACSKPCYRYVLCRQLHCSF
ncbi:hypothetical protein BO79DRAFT_67357 [Aspergillus costaricaensis CBS 115574]|uniref:Uncharacterized protein n=1 Tax=Aspergillus costaricaensis CBS 115574 TaxID=1448317 RepID=A0ACD1HZ50_9EURO|nr:hypothetical protein BO79DRAFT_67357 [Aspergillus costaricaensis CBS 115574]RAK83580.1 hypothetical protein BO79DRAFT_67357 [Aspergillus costaricaensis CBS 115574]